MNLSKPTERSMIADITALLPALSEDGLRRVQAEVNIALSVHSGKRDQQAEAAKDYTASGRNSVAQSQNCAT